MAGKRASMREGPLAALFRRTDEESPEELREDRPRREIDLPTHHMGPPLVNLDKSTQLAGELDDEEFVRKMLLGQ